MDAEASSSTKSLETRLAVVETVVIDINNEMGDLWLMMAQLLQQVVGQNPVETQGTQAKVNRKNKERVQVEAVGQNSEQIERKTQERIQDPFKNPIRSSGVIQNPWEIHNPPARRQFGPPRTRSQDILMPRFMIQDSDSSDEDENFQFLNQEQMGFPHGRKQYLQEHQDYRMKVDLSSFD